MSIQRIARWRLASNLYQILYHENKVICKKFSSLTPNSIEKNVRIICPVSIVTKFQTRNYPKNKDRVKHGAKKVELREDLMSDYINVNQMKLEMEKFLQKLKDEFVQNLSLRSSIGSIEEIPLEFEGEKYTIRDLAQINRKNPKVIALSFAAFPQIISTVLEALNNSGMNLNPQQDGTSIFVPIPKVTKEHRQILAKSASTLFHKCKSDIREVQFKFTKKLELKQNEGLSMEQFLIVRDQILALANVYISKAEKMKDDKTKELLGDE